MAANIQEVIVAFSKTAQSAIDAPSTDVIRVTTASDDMVKRDPVVEDDADEIGKGHEFAEESEIASWNVTRKVSLYNCAEMFSIAAAFGLGNGNAGTYKPIDPTTDTHEIEMPWMTFYEGVRPTSTSPIEDTAYLGMVVDKWGFKIESGPGKKASMLTMDLIGTGKMITPSGLSYPAKTPTHKLRSASATCVINGMDPVTDKTFESFSFDWDNKLREGFFPGSGFQTPGDPTSGAVRGRQEFGTRSLKMVLVQRLKSGSRELKALLAQTAGTAVLGMSGGTGFECGLNASQIRFKTAEIGQSGGIVTVSTDMSVQVPAGGSAADLITITASNTLGAVGRA